MCFIKHDFGELAYQKQSDEDVVVLCVYDKGVLKPLKVLLPHQIYEKDVEELKKKYRTDKVVCIPVKSSDYVYL